MSGYSAFKRGHAGVADLLQRAEQIALPVIVLGELSAGFRLGEHLEKNMGELEQFMQSPRVREISVDSETALRYTEIVVFLRTQSTSIPTNDILMAASAMQYGFRVVGTDRHFERVPQVARHIF